MRKIIILVLIMGFVGSAGAAEVTYHFTAEIQGYVDEAGIFSELGYSANMPLKGTITIDSETQPLRTHLEPDASGAFGWWDTGVILFENQKYAWLDTYSPSLLIVNYASYHQTDITTKQGSLDDYPGVSLVSQKITLQNDGLDASMPTDLIVGFFSEYFVQITDNGKTSWFKATITSIMNEEAYTSSTRQRVETKASAEEIIQGECACDMEWKNHGQYVRCVTQSAKELVAAGTLKKKEERRIVSEAAQGECGKNKNTNRDKNKKK